MKYIKFILPPLILLSAFFVFNFAKSKIPIKYIDCTNQYGECSKNIAQLFQGIEGSNIGIAKKELHKKLENSIMIKNYQMHYEFPYRMKIDVIERKPKYVLTNEAGTQVLIDETGIALEQQDSVSLPGVIVDYELPHVGDKVDSKTMFALEIVYDTFTLYQIKQGKLFENRLVIEFDSGQNVLFPLEGDRELLVGSLVLIMSNIDENLYTNESNKIVNTIDLRYDNPVLR